MSLLAVVSGQPHLVAAQTTASISIDARKVENRISPLLYGQFLEFMYEGIKGGLHGELIRNRSFEEAPNAIGLPRHWERYPDDRNDDYALTFHWDDQFAFPPDRKIKIESEVKEHSLRVEAGDGVIERHGIYQPRIPLRAHLEYRGHFWLRTNDYKGKIMVALESDTDQHQAYATDRDVNRITDKRGDWRLYEFSLTPDRSDPLARLAILFPGRGTVWIDQVSFFPADVAEGWVRRDVFDKIALLKPAFIRWPGGNVAQDYRWLWGIGPRDERVTWTNLSWKNEPEPSDFGTDEFVMFARAVGAEPSITVNVEGRGATAEEAAAWVEYCNGPATSKYGAMRAANRHNATPYGVKFWEVGNEIWGSWVRGHSDAATYARNYNRYAQAMRAVDPSIKLIAVGDNDMNWNRTVLREAGRNIDYLAIHHYYGRREMQGDPLNLMARPLHFERFYAQVKQLLDELGLGRVKLAINEWGLDLPSERQYSMESALYGARLMNVFERSGDIVEMSAVSDLVNGWPGGIIQAGRQSVFVTPIFLVNQLYAEHRGDQRLASSVNSPTFNTTREGTNVPYLDAVASRAADGKTIFIKAVNTSRSSALRTTIDIQGVNPARRAEMKTVTAPSLNVSNDFSRLDAVSIQKRMLPGGRRLVVTLPKHSVSVIVLRTQ